MATPDDFTERIAKEVKEAITKSLATIIPEVKRKITDEVDKSVKKSKLEFEPDFKRTSNKEQYKANSKILHALEETETALDSGDVTAAKESLTEGKRN